LSKYPETLNVGEPINTSEGENIIRPGIVHRLDRETSGAILIAKTAAGHAWLKDQFKDRTISKKYLTFIWGELKEEFGTITRPIGRSGSNFPLWSAQRGTRGETREAETYWTRLWTGKADVEALDGSALMSEKFTLIQAEPKTGRTHQIRVHFLAVHHPVVGDTLYAPKKPMALGFERLALHAQSIEFENKEGKRVKVIAPLPVDFMSAVQGLNISFSTK
jgi:23S rRNA pseudouridine1911/1915/1917 synthase